jgi:peptide chain release factor 3
LLLFERGAGERIVEPVRCAGLEDPKLATLLPAPALKQLRDEVEMARGLSPPFSLQAYREGHMTPVFFGSALNNFGVRELLAGIAQLAPPPRPQPALPRPIAPTESKVIGFVFKVQANIDPQHRDRVAFLRICSGRFRRGMKLRQPRTGRVMSVQNPVFFLARDRNLAEEAWPGDILGIPNHGALRIGDTLTESGEDIRVTGIPNFAPEILRRVRLDDPMKSKHLRRALEQLAEEGVTRIFKPLVGGDWIVGVVGALQLEVLAARIKSEYELGVRFETAPYDAARWIEGEAAEVERFIDANRAAVAEDHDDAPVYLARNAWDLNTTIGEWPALRFNATREQA